MPDSILKYDDVRPFKNLLTNNTINKRNASCSRSLRNNASSEEW